MPLALRWVADTPELARHEIGTYYDLAESILALAWQRLDDLRFASDYARAIVPRLANFEGVKPRRVYGNEEGELPELAERSRRALTKAIVALLDSYGPFLLVPVMGGDSLIRPEDFSWMIDELRMEGNAAKKEIWASLIHDAFRPERFDHVEAILESALQEALIASKFVTWIQPVALNSETAAAARASLKQMKEMQAQQAKWKQQNERPLVPSVRERIERCLETAEAGDQSGWWRLCMEMTLGERSRTYGDEFEPDLSILPGWTIVDEALRARILTAAGVYLDRQDIDPENWLGRTDVMHRPALAGVKALVTLSSYKRDALTQLSDDVWRKWLPAIVDYPVYHNKKVEAETYPSLIARAYQAAPDALVSSFLEVASKEDKKFGHLFCLRKIRNCLDARLQSALLGRAKQGFVGSDSLKELLSLLIEFDNFDARSYAESLLTPQEVAASAGAASAAALSLIVEASDGGWVAVWPAIRANPEWAEALLLALPESLRGSRATSLADRIGPLNTADLFLWLNEHFPITEDVTPEGAHFVTPREALSHFRDGLLSRLRDSGTPESLVALQRLVEALPDLNYLPFYVIKARENLRRRFWSPLLPGKLFTLAKSPLSRIVLNSDGLVDALMESLIRLEERLQGHTPMAFVLWNQERKRGKLRPKSEAELSDVVKDHLTHDLRRHALVALREVEIRRTQSAEGHQGERVDIYVEGMVRHTDERVSAVIEVKGSWHPQVRTAMKDQLLDRYMNETGCNRGIYLVGWFSCGLWDQSDGRKNRTGTKSLMEARKFFEDMAVGLKSEAKGIRSCVLNCALR